MGWIAVDLVRMLLSVTLRRVLAQIITAIPTAFSSTRLAIRIHWAAIQLTIFATFTNAAANRKRRRTWTATAVTVLAAKVRLRRTQAFLLWTLLPDCQGTLKDTCPPQDGCAYRGSSGCYPQCSVLHSDSDCSQGGQWCQWKGSSCEQTPCNQLVQSACYDSMYCAWNNDKRTCEGKSLANIAGNVTFV